MIKRRNTEEEVKKEKFLKENKNEKKEIKLSIYVAIAIICLLVLIAVLIGLVIEFKSSINERSEGVYQNSSEKNCNGHTYGDFMNLDI